MKLTSKLSVVAVLAIFALTSCGSNRAGDINDNAAVAQDTKSDPNADNDGDGLTNGEEDANGNGKVDAGETDPNNRDSDGDGLWDGNEIIRYMTDPLNPDSDNDGITDGREVYSCDETIFDTEKLSTHRPANVNQEDVPNTIDALDPYNDSDGDGRTNMGEKLKGTNGCDPDDSYPWATESCEGMSLAGAVYIPGGFDVDGDGKIEAGFWFTPYPASATEPILEHADYANFNESMEEKFNILNGTSLNYSTGRVYHSNDIYSPMFKDQGGVSSNYHSNLYGMDIPIVIDSLNIPACADAVGDIGPSVPTNKQYIHVMKLIEASGGEADGLIKNNVLGNDLNAPKDYKTNVYYLNKAVPGELFREYTKDIAVLDGFTPPSYWDAFGTRIEKDDSGKAWTDIDAGDFNFPAFADPHAIVVRQGWSIDLTFGVASGDATKGSEVLFRMATPYLAPSVIQNTN